MLSRRWRPPFTYLMISLNQRLFYLNFFYGLFRILHDFRNFIGIVEVNLLSIITLLITKTGKSFFLIAPKNRLDKFSSNAKKCLDYLIFGLKYHQTPNDLRHFSWHYTIITLTNKSWLSRMHNMIHVTF